jgi:hypothetical protein
VAIFITLTAAPTTSAGRFWPLGPVGISHIPIFNQPLHYEDADSNRDNAQGNFTSHRIRLHALR